MREQVEAEIEREVAEATERAKSKKWRRREIESIKDKDSRMFGESIKKMGGDKNLRRWSMVLPSSYWHGQGPYLKHLGHV